MCSILILPLFLNLIISINAGPSSMPTDCPRRLKSMDRNAKILLIVTNPNQTMYKSADQFNREYCAASQEKLKKIGDYRACLKAFPRQLFNIVYTNAKKNVKAYCGSEAGREEFVSNLKCMNYDTFPQVVKLSHRSTALVETVLNLPDMDDIIPGICCGYYDIYKEAKNLLSKLCNQGGPGQKGTDYFIGLFHSAMQDAIDIMCGSYSSIETCEKKVPRLVRTLRVNVFNDSVSYDHTILVPFIGVIIRIDEDKNLPSRN